MTAIEVPQAEGASEATLRTMIAHLQLWPRDAALEDEATDLACRSMPAWQLMQQCMHRGIGLLGLDTGAKDMLGIGPLSANTPLFVMHRSGSFPDPDRYAADRANKRAERPADGQIIPQENAALREGLAAFVARPSEETSADVLRELITGRATLFVHVSEKAGAEGERPITSQDLALGKTDDGHTVRAIQVATTIQPDMIAPSLAERGIYCRPLVAWKLMQFCLYRGIMLIAVDGGLSTEVTVGPIGTDSPLRLVHSAEFQKPDGLP